MARITRRVSSSCADCGVNMRVSISMVVVGWLAVLPVGLSRASRQRGARPPRAPPAEQKTACGSDAACGSEAAGAANADDRAPHRSRARSKPHRTKPPSRLAVSSLRRRTRHKSPAAGRALPVTRRDSSVTRISGAVSSSPTRVTREKWTTGLTGRADNVGWRDQRFFGTYERTGKFVFSGLWDQIPQFYSVDTRTPYSPAPGVSPLTLDDAIQRSIQAGQADRNGYVPVATQFDLRESRNIGNFSAVATPNKALDIKAVFTTTRHTGELPWGASFGFSNDVEVALPYDSRTNDLSLGAEWMCNSAAWCRVAYDGSGSTTSTTSSSGTARSASTIRPVFPATDAWRCGRRTRRERSARRRPRNSHIARSSPASCVRRPRQRRAVAAVHHQPGAAAVGPAAEHDGR